MTAAPSSTPERFLRSTIASYLSLGIRLVVAFGARIVVTRFIPDVDFGLYDLALRIVTIAGAVRDLGISFHLIRDERRPYGTAVAFSLLSGVVVTLVLIVAAPLTLGFYPGLAPVVQVFALWVLFDGLVGVPRTYFERELAISRLVVPEVVRGLAMAALSIVLAVYGWGVWSLVLADVATAAIFAALVWRRAWGRIPLVVDWSLLPDLFRRGRLLFVIWVTFQLVTYIDSFVVGGLVDLRAVGQYGRAYSYAFLVRQIVFPRALVSALLDYRHDPARFTAAFRVGTIFLLACEVTAGFFLFFNAEKVVAIAFGSGWEPAIVLLKILCFVPFLDVFSELGGEVLKVLHEDRLWLAIMLLNLASLVGFGILFTRQWGATGMAAANFLLLGNAIMAWRMARIFRGSFGRLLLDMGLVYLVPGALFGLVAWWLPAASWGRFAASLLAAALAVLVLGLTFRRLFTDFLVTHRGRGGEGEAGLGEPALGG